MRQYRLPSVDLAHYLTRVRGVALVGLLLIAVAAALSQSAEAKPVPPGGDSHQIACRDLQQRAYDLLDEYKNLEAKNPERSQEIMNELRTIGSDWVSIGCKAGFGDIVGLETLPPSRYGLIFPSVVSPANNSEVVIVTPAPSGPVLPTVEVVDTTDSPEVVTDDTDPTTPILPTEEAIDTADNSEVVVADVDPPSPSRPVLPTEESVSPTGSFEVVQKSTESASPPKPLLPTKGAIPAGGTFVD
jgi:hypothetical protein